MAFNLLSSVIEQFGLNVNEYQIVDFGPGLINHTYKVRGVKNYILQQVNTNVFKQPKDIAENIALIEAYLKQHAPGYLFIAPLWTKKGQNLVKAKNGEYYRLFPFVEESVFVNAASNPKQAFEAARQFGNFTYLLHDFDSTKLHYTLPDFHDLKLRFNQFKEACVNATKERLQAAEQQIKTVYNNRDILFTYQDVVSYNKLPLRIIHHDTKISNVLFDQNDNGLCVIDLDTVMPGYYISDVGDMLRTYLSPVDEEEQDLEKVQINKDHFYAIYKGYFSVLGDILTTAEKELFIYSGKYMMYMQAIRFLTDYLNGDIYYRTNYPGQNLIRAKNQLTLLNRYTELEPEFKKYTGTGDSIT